MKIRHGFVSNSSSSSFLIVGVEVSPIDVDDLKLLESIGLHAPSEQDDYWDLGYGSFLANDGLTVYGNDEPSYVGIDAEALLRADMTLSDIRKVVERKFAKYGYTGKTDLYFGEAGNG